MSRVAVKYLKNSDFTKDIGKKDLQTRSFLSVDNLNVKTFVDIKDNK